LKKPLVGVTTLEAMCAAAMAEANTSYAASIHDARREEAYLAVVSEKGLLIASEIVPLRDAAARIKSAIPQGASIALAGTGAERVAGDLAQSRLTTIRQPDALWIARLAHQAPEPSEAPHPLYLRAPDAKLPAPS
jgi:tRNA threonylcarbamoyladenosine biosynthesis protein TsaB